jgi:hypothetical protein
MPLFMSKPPMWSTTTADRQVAQARRDLGQSPAVGPELRMQAGGRQARGEGDEVIERGAASEVRAGTAAMAEAHGAHTSIAQAVKRGQCSRSHHDHAAQISVLRQRMKEQGEVVAVGARMHENAMRQPEPRQQREVLRLQRLGRCVATVGCQREPVVGPNRCA